MSTTRNILAFLEELSTPFQKQFGFVLEFLDQLFSLQDEVGLTEHSLNKLSDVEQAQTKSFLFFVTSANTTAIGVLRLLSGNLFADAYALLRMLYEIACLLHYSAQSTDQSKELYRTFFKSGLPEVKHRNAEWELIKKAERMQEQEKPELSKLRQHMNNFGSHISRAKIVSGNVTNLGISAASTISTPNFNRREFVMALDLLQVLQIWILEAYNTHSIQFPGAAPSISDQISTLRNSFTSGIRPRLRAIIEDIAE
jgi:hypothetical protein